MIMNNIKQLSPVPIKIAGILPLYEMFKNMKTANIPELNTLANNITSETGLSHSKIFQKFVQI